MKKPPITSKHDKVFDIDITDFKKHGYIALEDTTDAPIGSLQTMRNALVTRRGGLSPRPGTLLLGSANTNAKPVRGLYNFRRSFSSDELLIKAYDDRLEYISKNYSSAGWNLLKSGFTSGSEFGFVTSLVNTSNQDYVIGGNRYEPYFSWTGAVAQTTSALVGGETSIPVDSTLMPDIYESQTATSNSSTTLAVSTVNWTTSQWVNFYVRITSGTYKGQIRLITANDATSITFSALAGAPGMCTFEIRQLAFPTSGTLIYGGNTVTYSSISSDSAFPVSSASAAASGTPITVQPVSYSAPPRGNRFTNYLTRIVVGNVRSALTRDSGGALQGYSSAGSVFVSKLNNPFDFTFSATRSAGEGDVISMPYGGGDITDVQAQEDTFYTFKARYIESIKYSQDSNDLATREPLKAGFGSIGKTIKGVDDIYFWTADKQITSIGRVKLNDQKPQTLNLGNQINRFLDICGADAEVGRGMEISSKIYFPIKLTPTSTVNDIILVYNRDTETFEGIWDIGANFIEFWNNGYYYGDSNAPDVYQMFYEHADVRGSDRFGIDFEVVSHAINLTASKAYLQSMYGFIVEGYVAGGASFTTNLWGDFSANPFLTFNFSFDESAFLDEQNSNAYLAGNPLALDPNDAVYGDPLDDGRRHFSFRVFFPFQYNNYYSFGFSANQPDNDFEITRVGLIISEPPSINTNRVKIL